MGRGDKQDSLGLYLTGRELARHGRAAGAVVTWAAACVFTQSETHHTTVRSCTPLQSPQPYSEDRPRSRVRCTTTTGSLASPPQWGGGAV